MSPNPSPSARSMRGRDMLFFFDEAETDSDVGEINSQVLARCAYLPCLSKIFHDFSSWDNRV